MPVSPHYWTPVYNAFDPFSPVPPDKLEAWFVERPRRPVDALLRRLDPGRLPQRTILVGHPASGKSSELTQLAAELARRYDYFVVRLDLEPNLDIERVNPLEVLFLVGAAIYKVAQAELEDKPNPELLQEMVRGLETVVRTHTDNKEFTLNVRDLLAGLICFGATVIGGPGAGAAARALTGAVTGFRFVSGTNKEIVRRLEVQPSLKEMVERLNVLIDEVQAKAGRPLVLIVDGLDKPRDEDTVALNFLHTPYLADIRCRVVYAAPMLVFYSPRFAQVRARFPILPFPNIKLHKRGAPEKRDQEGYRTMREVVQRRLHSLGLTPERVIAPEALDDLIRGSGGVMRDLIRLVQDAALNAESEGKDRIDRAASGRALADLRMLYEAQLTPPYRSVLERVRDTNQRTEDRECDELLQGNFVLSYLNDDVWFDVHSILRE